MLLPCVPVTGPGDVSYRGDQDLQAFLLGADVLGRVDHGPRGAAAVQLGGGNEQHNVSTTGGSTDLIRLTPWQ